MYPRLQSSLGACLRNLTTNGTHVPTHKQQDMGEELDDHNRRLEILNRDVGDRTQKTTTLVHDIKRRL